jgi:hypothetical protein
LSEQGWTFAATDRSDISASEFEPKAAVKLPLGLRWLRQVTLPFNLPGKGIAFLPQLGQAQRQRTCPGERIHFTKHQAPRFRQIFGNASDLGQEHLTSLDQAIMLAL